SDAALVTGVPVGQFVCKVVAEGYAKTVSQPFEIAAETTSQDVLVTVHHGATLRGRVMDERGVPLHNATVTTQAQGALPDNPLWRIMSGATPGKVTTTSCQTREDGSFELRQLARGSYELV